MEKEYQHYVIEGSADVVGDSDFLQRKIKEMLLRFPELIEDWEKELQIERYSDWLATQKAESFVLRAQIPSSDCMVSIKKGRYLAKHLISGIEATGKEWNEALGNLDKRISSHLHEWKLHTNADS